MECNFCGNSFKTEDILLKHQGNAKYCIQIQKLEHKCATCSQKDNEIDILKFECINEINALEQKHTNEINALQKRIPEYNPCCTRFLQKIINYFS